MKRKQEGSECDDHKYKDINATINMSEYFYYCKSETIIFILMNVLLYRLKNTFSILSSFK